MPIAIELDGQRLLFIGGGKACVQKLNALARFISPLGPFIHLVAPKIDPSLSSLLEAFPKHRISERTFLEEDLDDADLVYCFIDDSEDQKKIAELCRVRKIWSNIAHERGTFSFTSPAIRLVDDFVVSVGHMKNEAKKSVELANKIVDFLNN